MAMTLPIDDLSYGCFGAAPASDCVSSVVSDRKISSRLMRIGRSSSSPHPLVTTALGEIAADVASALALDLVADDAVLPIRLDDADDAGEPAERRRGDPRPARRPARTSFPIRGAAR